MSSEPPIIEVEDVRKTYRVGLGRARVREMVPPPFDRVVERIAPRWWTKNTFDALSEVSMEVSRGSSVGLVGHNGAGKTTMLKVLSGVTEPTKGRVAIHGRVAALIDVMVGFNPELTGQENVYVLGALHGFSRSQMRERFDRIVAFSEIDSMLDTPVKRYSAGMGARLGFATMTALDVDVLMIDEVLAVGDAAFQRKCIGWLESFREEGGTLLFVSHNLALVRSMTDRAVWLDHGSVMKDGPTDRVLADYAKAMEQREASNPARKRDATKALRRSGRKRWGTGGAFLEEVKFGDTPMNGEPLQVTIDYESVDLRDATFCVGFLDESGRQLGAAASPSIALEPGRGTMRCSIEPFLLRDGIYFPVVAILSSDGQVRDRWRLERALVVERGGPTHLVDTFGPVDIQAGWDNDPEREETSA
jgi:lipopolysaccharide transport system ATP-binding protein